MQNLKVEGDMFDLILAEDLVLEVATIP